MTGERRVVKCDGRFSGLRTYLYDQVLPVVLDEGRTKVTREDVKNMWDLVNGDVLAYDYADPYFNDPRKGDNLRMTPEADYHSIVPLLADPLIVDKALIEEYCKKMGNREHISKLLATFGDKPRRFLETILKREPRDVGLVDGKTLSGYVVGANFGVGAISHGGVHGGGIRSDTPFLLEIYKQSSDIGGEQDLASVVGFWPQNNYMLVSQMQPCRNAELPQGVPFGVSSLRIAESIAQSMGFKGMLVYSARSHPIFREHPNDWAQFGKDFVCQWDGSSKKLGYDGSRNHHYVKKFTNDSERLERKK